MALDEKKETEDPFLRSKLQYLYNIDLLEKKYRALEAQELDSRIEIDFISGQVYFPKDASKRAVQRAYRNLKRLNKEFGSSFLKDLWTTLITSREAQALHSIFSIIKILYFHLWFLETAHGRGNVHHHRVHHRATWKHCRDPSQTALSGFVNFAGEYRESSGENSLDNGMKEDRRAMAAAKSRNRLLRDGYIV
uniref:Uncharacterized protein n=1 Tax=Haemonchus contortus TaxID=6289 RepID=A0A7I4Y1K8_HAECO